MLVVLLAALLCCLYAADTIILSYCFRFYSHNPSSSKLLVLSEALKLVIASCLYLLEKPEKTDETPDSDVYKVDSTHYLRQRGQKVQQPDSKAQSCWQRAQATAKALLVFSVPSLCYFATNNLSIYALQLMSAHVYTLLCDLKVITTGLLNYMFLDKRLNQRAVFSLLVLFLGICLGQYATMRDSAGSIISMMSTSSFKSAGFFLMVFISFISATASVYTEWVMNYSHYKRESLNLQNMRLYGIGVVLNATYYIQTGGQLHGFLSDMGAPHWAVVLVLALMGLVTGVLIKRYGNIIKVYASSIASLFAAWLSQVLLKDPPPALFYAGVCLAMAATLQLQRAREERSSPAGESQHARLLKQSNQPGVTSRQRCPAILVVTVGLTIIVLVLVPLALPWSQDEVSVPHRRIAGPGASLIPHGIVGDPFPVLPPFEPTCLVRFEHRTKIGCLPMKCSLDERCTVTDTQCCAYFNFRVLQDVDRLLLAQGLQEQYALVYGSALGAARNQSILGHTHDVDMALSPTALQIMAQNSTREQLWRKGYVLWHDRYMWRICPHHQHPEQEFRNAMVGNTSHVSWIAQSNQSHVVYMDVYLMWPVPEGASSCAVRSANRNETAKAAILMQPLTASDGVRGRTMDIDVTRADGDGASDSVLTGNKSFCLQQSKLPVIIAPGQRKGQVADQSFPVPANLHEHLLNTYGPNWTMPDVAFHGNTQVAPDFWAVQEALLSWLSVTAWGDLSWQERRARCLASRQQQQQQQEQQWRRQR